MIKQQHPLQTLFRLTLLGLCALFSFLLWQEFSQQHYLNNGVSREMNKADFPNLKIEKRKITHQDITKFDEITKRPLFNNTRQPFIAPKPNATAKKTTQKNKKLPVKKEQFMLSATVITPDKRIAVLQTSRDKTQQRISLGEEFNGWILHEITPHSVKLTKGKQIKNLELEIKKSAPAKKTKKQTQTKTAQETTRNQRQPTATQLTAGEIKKGK